ncbi:hypothetical protein [Sorangium sp. So ce1389]|uniref:hypothetical protein n=1 Tax=Sorangium sp. So ce1389 TaxID=3133336 RepID=UPI003F61C281
MNDHRDVSARAGLQVPRQQGHRAIGMVDREAHERDGAEHVEHVGQPRSVVIRTANRLHMIRVLLGQLSRKHPLGELGEGGFSGCAGARFALAQLVDGKPDIPEGVSLARRSLLQQRQTEHDLSGGKESPRKLRQHLQPRVGFLLRTTRRQGERGSTGLAEAEACGPRLPAQPDRA